MNEQKTDNVNHPAHYTWLKDLCGIEVIDITRHMNFCCGCALKYILRAGHKKDASLTDTEKQIEDLNKADGFVPDFSNWRQVKWFPWFKYNKDAAGFVFAHTNYTTTYAATNLGSRICFMTSERAEQFGKQFADLYNKVFL